ARPVATAGWLKIAGSSEDGQGSQDQDRQQVGRIALHVVAAGPDEREEEEPVGDPQRAVTEEMDGGLRLQQRDVERHAAGVSDREKHPDEALTPQEVAVAVADRGVQRPVAVGGLYAPVREPERERCGRGDDGDEQDDTTGRLATLPTVR